MAKLFGTLISARSGSGIPNAAEERVLISLSSSRVSLTTRAARVFGFRGAVMLRRMAGSPYSRQSSE